MNFTASNFLKTQFFFFFFELREEISKLDDPPRNVKTS